MALAVAALAINGFISMTVDKFECVFEMFFTVKTWDIE